MYRALALNAVYWDKFLLFFEDNDLNRSTDFKKSFVANSRQTPLTLPTPEQALSSFKHEPHLIGWREGGRMRNLKDWILQATFIDCLHGIHMCFVSLYVFAFCGNQVLFTADSSSADQEITWNPHFNSAVAHFIRKFTDLMEPTSRFIRCQLVAQLVKKFTQFTKYGLHWAAGSCLVPENCNCNMSITTGSYKPARGLHSGLVQSSSNLYTTIVWYLSLY